MKKICILLTFAGFSFYSSNAQKVEIAGQLNNMPGARMVYLNYTIAGERLTDSTPVKNGQFEFTEKLEEVSNATLVLHFDKDPKVRMGRRDVFSFYMEPGKIKLEASDSLRFANVTGSKSQLAYVEYKKLFEAYVNRDNDHIKTYMNAMQNSDVETAKRVGKEMQEIREYKTEKITLPYILENPNSPIALNLLIGYAGYDIRAKKIEPIFESFPKSVQNSPSGHAFRAEIELAKKSGIGLYAQQFTQNDTAGKPISLASFKGKYVLLDFWASWCAPCRKENPFVVKAYNKYKEEGFTVLSVSLDGPGKHKAWVDAIRQDGLTWTHVSDLKLKENAVAKLYGITAIPQNFLIDPTGKIIAKNLRGAALENELNKIFVN